MWNKLCKNWIFFEILVPIKILMEYMITVTVCRAYLLNLMQPIVVVRFPPPDPRDILKEYENLEN
jgi:hypothetical protein